MHKVIIPSVFVFLDILEESIKLSVSSDLMQVSFYFISLINSFNSLS